MNKITISQEIKKCATNVRLGIIECNLAVSPSSSDLLKKINVFIDHLRASENINEIHSNHSINETRMAYKAFGKEPSRYRPSAEALRRSILQGKDLYKINKLVEIVNWCSLETGFSIGAYHNEFISGVIKLGIGKANEEYEAIGRGSLNIEYLLVLRDALTAFGSPTSDSERTKITENTTTALFAYFDFNRNSSLDECLGKASSRLKEYAQTTDFRILTIN